MVKTHALNNPYTVGGPGITDPRRFVGRGRELGIILDEIRKHGSCHVVGPIKIGRTSLLRMVAHPEMQRRYGLTAEQVVPVFLDFQELVPSVRAHEVYGWMLSHLQRALRREVVVDRDVAPYEELAMQLRSQETAGGRVVFLCDNFEAVASLTNLEASFLNTLRALVSNYCSMVIASPSILTDSLRSLQDPVTSPFWNVFSRHNLGVLEEAEAHRLVVEPREGEAGLAEELVEHVTSFVGRHPYLLQMLCSELFILDARALSEAFKEEFIAKHHDVARDWWERLPPEQSLLINSIRATQLSDRGPLLAQHRHRGPLHRAGWLMEANGKWSLVPFLSHSLERFTPLETHPPDEEISIRPETIVVVDICASTHRTSKYGFALMRRLKAELCSIIEQFGQQHDMACRKSIGDGYLLAFPCSDKAVRTAIDVLRHLRQRNQAVDPSEKICVRFAIHFGEVAVLPADREGPEVTFTFRMEAVEGRDIILVRGGIRREEFPTENYIVVSEAVYEDLRGLEHVPVRLIGHFDPRGIWGIHRIYQVLWDS